MKEMVRGMTKIARELKASHFPECQYDMWQIVQDIGAYHEDCGSKLKKCRGFSLVIYKWLCAASKNPKGIIPIG